MNKILNFKKIVSIGFFAAFLAVFLSANSVNAIFWDWFRTGDDNVAATSASSKTYTLKTNKSGLGVVTSNDGKINCGSDCSEKYKSSPVAAVTLMAAPSSGYSFDKWSGGGCGGSGNCTVKMTKSTTVTAKFKKVKTTGGPQQRTGGGSSSSSSSNSSSPIDWSLISSSSSSSSVSSAGSSSSSSLVSQKTLKVTVSGDGKIISSPSGISCKKSSGSCEAKFNQKDSVTLTASTPVGGSYSFGVWGKDCANAGKSPTCIVIMGSDKKVSATFNSTIKTTNETVNVSVRKSGTGKGKVVSTSSGKEDKRISCGNDCSENYEKICEGTAEGRGCSLAYFRAVPDSGNTFEGWGGCLAYTSAKDQCYVILDGDKSITANFKASSDSGAKYKLEVVYNDGGEVWSDDGKINCGKFLLLGTDGGINYETRKACKEKYSKDAKVVLHTSATGKGGYILGFSWVGYKGSCNEVRGEMLDICEIKMNGDKKIGINYTYEVFTSSASFSSSSSVSSSNSSLSSSNHSVTLKIEGEANGIFRIDSTSIGSSPCYTSNSKSCVLSNIPNNDTATLEVSSLGDSFKGWSGDNDVCDDTQKTCKIKVDADKIITATF